LHWILLNDQTVFETLGDADCVIRSIGGLMRAIDRQASAHAGGQRLPTMKRQVTGLEIDRRRA
jgi:hypothetical protein